MSFINYTDIIPNKRLQRIDPDYAMKYSPRLQLSPVISTSTWGHPSVYECISYINTILFSFIHPHMKGPTLTSSISIRPYWTELAIILLMWVSGESVVWRALRAHVLSEAERGFMNHGDAKTCIQTSLAHTASVTSWSYSAQARDSTRYSESSRRGVYFYIRTLQIL